MELQIIQKKIYEIRGHKVMLDFHLAELYQTENRALKQAVKRNLKRFPPDFMFIITKKEWQQVITICDNLPPNAKFSPALPFAFTEQGLAMLSTVLNSDIAIEVNIEIIRAFVFLRKYSLTHKDIMAELKKLESKFNKKFKDVLEAINYLLQKDKVNAKNPPRKKIGFKIKSK